MSKPWSKPLKAAVSVLMAAGLFVPSAMAHGVAKHAPAPRGTIIFSDNQFPDTLNPFQAGLAVDSENLALTMPTGDFLSYDPHGRLLSQMLTTVPSIKNHGITNGGKTITLHFHKGLKWSNGQPIVAKDLWFYWKVAMNPQTGPYCTGWCDHIGSISLPNKYTAVLHMKNVYAPAVPNAIPGLLPYGWGKLTTNVATAAKTEMATSFNYENSSYVTAGPYKISQFVNNARIELTPNKYYHYPGGPPKVGKYIFLFYSDVDTEIAGAAKHETDETTDYTLAQLPTLLAHKNAFKTQYVSTLSPEHLELNMLDKTVNGQPNPLVNQKVRQAISLAIDRFGIQRSVFGVRSKKVARNLFTYDAPLVETPSIKQPFADPAIKGAWDPIRKRFVPYSALSVRDAKTLLKGTPCAHGCNVQISSTTLPQRAAEAGVITKNLSRIGINASFTAIPASQFFTTYQKGGTLATGKFEMAIFAYVGVTPDPDGWKFNMQSKYINRLDPHHSPVDSNNAGLRDKIVDKAFNKAAATLKPAQRRHWYYVAQVEIAKQVPWIDLSIRPEFCTYDSKVAGYRTNGYSAAPCDWNSYQEKYR